MNGIGSEKSKSHPSPPVPPHYVRVKGIKKAVPIEYGTAFSLRKLIL
jgi:hypothetical protein